MGDTFLPFASWEDLLTHVRAGQATYYQAPLDFHPVRL